MKFNLKKETEEDEDINSGDILIVTPNNEERAEYKEVPFLFIYDESGDVEKWYLICLSSFYVYDAEDYCSPSFTENNKEVVFLVLEQLNYSLVEVIPSDEVELRRVSKNKEESKTILNNIIKVYYDFSNNIENVVKNDLEALDLIVESYEDFRSALDILYDEEEGEIVIRIYIINNLTGYTIETIDVDIDTIKSIKNDKELSSYMMKTLLENI